MGDDSMGLAGRHIVIAGSRKLEEMSVLIEKQGGIPLLRSLQGTVFLAEKEVESTLQKLVKEKTDCIIFTTGIGFETLVGISENLSIKAQFLKVIKKANVASRGYKTEAALKKFDVTPVVVDEDGTTAGLMKELAKLDLNGKKVTVQLHGDPAPELIKFLEDQGATVLQLVPYKHKAPETETVAKLSKEIIDHQVDAVCFTSAIQVRALFSYARKHGLLKKIIAAFKQDVLAVAVGKVTAEALKGEKIHEYLAPKRGRIGAIIVDLAHYFEEVDENERTKSE